MIDLGKKLEAKIDKLQETLSQEIVDVRIKETEMQNTVTEIKKLTRRNQQQNTEGRGMTKQGRRQTSGKSLEAT